MGKEKGEEGEIVVDKPLALMAYLMSTRHPPGEENKKMALIELYEDNGGNLYIVDAEGNIIPDLECANSTFLEDAASVDDWKEPDRYITDSRHHLGDNIADYDTETGKILLYRCPGAAGSKYLGIDPDSDAETVEEIADEIGAVVS